MIVSSKGEITDAIEVPDTTEIFEFYRVLVMVGDLENKKCVGQEDFEEFPDEAQVIWAVAQHNGSYAEITKILVPQPCGGCDGDCFGCKKLDEIELEAKNAMEKMNHE